MAAAAAAAEGGAPSAALSLAVPALTPLHLREAEGGGAAVVGAIERICATPADALAALAEGCRVRATGATGMNVTSSRSHAVFSVTLRQRLPVESEAPSGGSGEGSAAAVAVPTAFESRVSKFNVLDLAGSERAKRTRAEGARFREGVAINLGLLALGNVISALADDDARRRGAYVP
jgi:hypothetical protein